MIHSLSSRFEYKTLEKMIYLNQASLGLISDTSINAMHQFLDNIGRHGNSMMTDEEEVNFFDDLRDTASLLFNCSIVLIGLSGLILQNIKSNLYLRILK